MSADGRKRGTHGCYIHTDQATSDLRRWRPVKCSRHHTRMGAPTPERPTGVPGTECIKCGATVVRSREGNAVREVWTFR